MNLSEIPGNCLLSKTPLGCVKQGFHSLPPSHHTYGKSLEKDKYGARQVIGNWELCKLSEAKQGGKNYVEMNKKCVKHGCLDPKNVAEFRKHNQVKIKLTEGKKFYDVRIPDENFIYGIQNRPSTPIKNVICNCYGNEEQQLKEQKEAVRKLLQKEKKPCPSVEFPRVKMRENSSPREQRLKQKFKLSKFKNTPSKIKSLMNKSPTR